MRFVTLLPMAAMLSIAQAAAPLQKAAALYHQGRFEPALDELDEVRALAPLKRRDSLSLLQYSGMASARLGREGEAVGHFDGLLGIDSLFQFPRNEDPLVLTAFARARREREGRAAMPAPAATGPVPAAAPGPASPVPYPPAQPFAFADSGTGRPAHSPTASGPEKPRTLGFALGAIPLGGGWLAKRRMKHGLALGFLQAAGLGVSLYASQRISSIDDPVFGTMDHEKDAVNGWQWVQRVSLSTALGAYLFSLIAATGE